MSREEHCASFINKPSRGWIHPDILISKEGATYSLRYIGCLDVLTSMKSLDFETRSHVAKECINRICEAAGLKTADKKRRVDKRVARCIADHPKMEYAGTNVNLNVSSSSLSLVSLESGQRIASHDMPRISFASGGDTNTLDFVAYVAKDAKEWRACYVLECGGGLAQDVIATIGQAFELRFKQYLNKPVQTGWSLGHIGASGGEPDRDYYNDLPGKVPPDVGPPPVPPLPAVVPPFTTLPSVPSPNLIDLNSELPPSSMEENRAHDYVNDMIVGGSRTAFDRDVFDMQPFTANTGRMGGALDSDQLALLQKENWFHGPVSRAEAERLLQKDGDFLVRESQATAGQYVLTGMQGNIKKHLLLIDPEGVVRTKDRMFHSVSHLINYHCENLLPIISEESALVLREPIHRS